MGGWLGYSPPRRGFGGDSRRLAAQPFSPPVLLDLMSPGTSPRGQAPHQVHEPGCPVADHQAPEMMESPTMATQASMLPSSHNQPPGLVISDLPSRKTPQHQARHDYTPFPSMRWWPGVPCAVTCPPVSVHPGSKYHHRMGHPRVVLLSNERTPHAQGASLWCVRPLGESPTTTHNTKGKKNWPRDHTFLPLSGEQQGKLSSPVTPNRTWKFWPSFQGTVNSHSDSDTQPASRHR